MPRGVPRKPTHEELMQKVEEEAAINIVRAKPVLEQDLYKFNKYILKAEEGKEKVPLAPVHKEMCDFVSKNRRKKKLVLIPRGHLKSSLVTVGRAVQAIVADPTVRILIANATYNLACSFLTEVKRHLKFNENIRMMWGELANNPENWSANQITLAQGKVIHGKKEPTVTAMGIESNMTSQHYDMIILDDLVNKDYINTAEQIEKTIDFYKESLNLLEPNGELIAVGTRWDDRDLYGWIMDKDNNVIHDFDIFLRRAFEGDLKTGEAFQAIFPGKFTRKHLFKLYEQQGPYFFSSQYLNDPIPSEDAVFKQEWFHYYEPLNLRGMPLTHFTTVDPAISLEKDADFTAIVTTAMDQYRNIYIREIIRKRLTPSGIIAELFRIWEQYHPSEFALEDVAYQKALQYSLSEEMRRRNVYLPVREVKPANRSKVERIKGLQPLYVNAKIWHSKTVYNNQHLEDELLRFPRGKHDDVIDSLSYVLDVIYPPKRKVTRPRSHKYLYAQ